MDSDYLEIFEDLIQGSSEIIKRKPSLANLKDVKSGNSLLHMLAYSDKEAQILFLLKCNADIDNRNKNGQTPLHWAAVNGCIRATIFLINAGANVNISDNSGSYPLHCAAANGHSEIVALLILSSTACNPDVQDADGCTALMIAKRMKSSASPQIRNNYIAVIAFLQRLDLPHTRQHPQQHISNKNRGEQKISVIHPLGTEVKHKSAPTFCVRAMEYDITGVPNLTSPEKKKKVAVDKAKSAESFTLNTMTTTTAITTAQITATEPSSTIKTAVKESTLKESTLINDHNIHPILEIYPHLILPSPLKHTFGSHSNTPSASPHVNKLRIQSQVGFMTSFSTLPTQEVSTRILEQPLPIPFIIQTSVLKVHNDDIYLNQVILYPTSFII